MGYFVMRRGPYKGRVYRLEGEEITIGRGARNTITIHDNEVSREHLRLLRIEDGFELRDLNSSNGTFINGQPVDKVWVLRTHCIIELGDSITLEYWPGDPPDDIQAVSEDNTFETIAYGPSYLIVNIPSGGDPAVYVLDAAVNTIGRSKENTIVIVEPEVSRQHFSLRLTNQGYILEDLGSTNGTFVNGRRLDEPHLLSNGDVFQIGTSVFFQLTNTPERYVSRISTDHLSDTNRLNDTERRRPGRIKLPQNPDTGQTDNLALKEQVLITYARSEWEPVVKPLVKYLRSADVTPWVDQDLVEGTPEWAASVEQARLECRLLVVVLSPTALDSETVRKHWWHFRNREKPIILVEYEPVEQMPIGSDRLTLIRYSPRHMNETFKRVLRIIERNG